MVNREPLWRKVAIPEPGQENLEARIRFNQSLSSELAKAIMHELITAGGSVLGRTCWVISHDIIVSTDEGLPIEATSNSNGDVELDGAAV